jgi:hypothetical protein
VLVKRLKEWVDTQASEDEIDEATSNKEEAVKVKEAVPNPFSFARNVLLVLEQVRPLSNISCASIKVMDRPQHGLV